MHRRLFPLLVMFVASAALHAEGLSLQPDGSFPPGVKTIRLPLTPDQMAKHQDHSDRGTLIPLTGGQRRMIKRATGMAVRWVVSKPQAEWGKDCMCGEHNVGVVRDAEIELWVATLEEHGLSDAEIAHLAATKPFVRVDRGHERPPTLLCDGARTHPLWQALNQTQRRWALKRDAAGVLQVGDQTFTRGHRLTSKRAVHWPQAGLVEGADGSLVTVVPTAWQESIAEPGWVVSRHTAAGVWVDSLDVVGRCAWGRPAPPRP